MILELMELCVCTEESVEVKVKLLTVSALSYLFLTYLLDF